MLQSPSVTIINLISRIAVCVLEVIIYVHSHKNSRATACFYGHALGCGCSKAQGEGGIPCSSGAISLHQPPVTEAALLASCAALLEAAGGRRCSVNPWDEAEVYASWCHSVTANATSIYSWS